MRFVAKHCGEEMRCKQIAMERWQFTCQECRASFIVDVKV